MTNSFIWPDKDPNATLDYGIDWAKWLVPGDTIATSIWTVPAGITSVLQTTTTTSTTIWLSGGVDKIKYSLTNTIHTVGGRIDERSVTFKVRNK